MTRRGRGEGSVYQRGDNRWVGVLNLGWAEGKRRRKVVYAATRREAVVKLGALQRDHLAGTLLATAPTVESWMRYWLDHVAVERVRVSTLAGYRSKADNYIVPQLGRHRLDQLRASHLRSLYAAMRDKGLSDATVRQTHAILHRALKVAVREERVRRNVAEQIDAPKVPKDRRTPLTVAQARQVLTAAKDTPLESRWYVALYLGLRQGEALGLRWVDVDLQTGVLYVRQALQRVAGRGLVIVQPKSRTSHRAVPIPTIVGSRLAVHWAQHAARGGTLDGYVWSRPDGSPIDPHADWKAWQQLLERAGVPHVALHAARNTAISLLMAAGVPDKVASEIVGHSTVQITRDIYQRGDPEQHRRAMAALEAYVNTQ